LLTGLAVIFSWGGVLVGPPLFGLALHATDSYQVAWLALAAVALIVAVTLPRLQPLVQREPVTERAA
jgi:cyanate permease